MGQKLDDESVAERGGGAGGERERENTRDTKFHRFSLCLLLSEINLKKVLTFDNQKRRSSMSAPTNPSPSQSHSTVWNQN